MEEMNWTQTVTNFVLIVGAVVTLSKIVNAAYKYADKKKNSHLQESIDKVTEDIKGVKKEIEDVRKIATADKSSIHKLEDDYEYLVKLLLDKSLRK